MTNELFPCGCGGDAGIDLTDFEWAESQSFHVKCLKCGVRTPVGTARSPISQAKAIRIWQKSHAPLSGITEEMVERIEDALHQIDQWAKAYPEDIFPKPDLKEANRLLTEGGVSFTALNAYSMNHVIQRVKGIIDGSGIRDLLRQQGAEGK